MPDSPATKFFTQAALPSFTLTLTTDAPLNATCNSVTFPKPGPRRPNVLLRRPHIR